MQIFVNEDKNVYKFIHEDMSETAIKFVSSCSCEEEQRNKYSIFISSSVGCQLECKFCYLTTKNFKYHSLNSLSILNNLKEAIQYFIIQEPEKKDFFVKICWMGMGEDSIIKLNLFEEVTEKILEYILIENKFAKGLDGVDIRTVLPLNSNLKVFFDIKKLNNSLQKYPLNPNNNLIVNVENSSFLKYENRSIVRLFYSLHSCIEKTRNYLIPRTFSLKDSLTFLMMLNQDINIIFHYFFIDKINDTEEEIQELLNTLEYLNKNFKYYELRILRLNSCEKLNFKESEQFDDIIKILKNKTDVFKVQVSAGSEIKARCGQFLMKHYQKE